MGFLKHDQTEGRMEWKVFNIALKLEYGNFVIKKMTIRPFKIGHGFDLHYLKPNLPFIIGANNIPRDYNCKANSNDVSC